MMPPMTDVLDVIDGVLRDYETSSDAMRWVPGCVICDGGKPLQIGRTPAAVLHDLGLVFAGERAANSMAGLGEQFRALGQTLTAAWLPAIKAAGEMAHSFDLALRPAWHLRECARCRPVTSPRPLCIDGHEYRRRQRSRRRRRR